MEISWGLIILFVLVLFPGLIFRRLYYYGEFSKQFGSGLSLIKLIAISSIPGLINLICIFLIYDTFFYHIDIELVINRIKDLSNPELKLEKASHGSMNSILKDSVFPFLSFLYVSSILLGALSGRLIRITRLDTKFKLLQFKNYWFYVFSGELARFKKMKHLKNSNKKHLFTVADILVESSSKTHLYSGIVVDYELNEKDCQCLNKVMLQNAERYKEENDKMVPKKIPGSMLVVDCAKMKNINLTYVFEEAKGFLQSKVPGVIDTIFALVIVLALPIFFFQTDLIKWDWYISYFKLNNWFNRILWYLLIVQTLSILNPFVKNKSKGEYEYVGWNKTWAKVFWIVVLIFLIWKF